MTSREPIHSGHFMTSNPHTDPTDEEDEDVEVEVVDDEEYRLVTEEEAEERRALKDQNEKPVTFYKFGPKKTQSIAIDVSLNKLNKCIKVAYNKLTTPKWKDFKGLRLDWKQRIRLNNVIWRAYHMEFRKTCKKPGKRTPYCYFAVPDYDTTHAKLEGSVLEGMYWKRRIEAVCAQYKRWRHFNKNRRKGRKRENSCNCDIAVSKTKPMQNQSPKTAATAEFDIDDYDNVFTDNLFLSLSQPYMFPNPKEMAQGCNADVMQPGLLSLQPSLEDIMHSFDQSNEPPPESVIEPSIPPPTTSTAYSSKEYDAASLLVDYGNQSQPTRQSSVVSAQTVMANSCTPTYSQAAYERVPLSASGPYSADSSTFDYVPQFLTSATLPSTSTMISNKSWWMNFQSNPIPTHSVLSGGESSTPPLMRSPSIPSPSTPSGPHISAPLLLPSTDNPRAVTPSKGALKAYPSNLTPQKLSDHWTAVTNVPVASTSLDTANSIAGSQTRSPWKQYSMSNNGHALPIPQPLYPVMSTHMSTPSVSVFNNPSTPALSVMVKEETEKDDRRAIEGNGFRLVAADSTNERKRILHLNAEQNRRSALKDGFDQLVAHLPNMFGSGTKPTNAVILARAAQRIRELKSDIEKNAVKAESYRQNIARLNRKIASLQATLPSSPRSSSNISQRAVVEQFFERYMKERSRQDARFWVMAKMLKPLTDSLADQLCEENSSCESIVAACRVWLNTNWSPANVRQYGSPMCLYLATNTTMFTNPSGLREHVLKEISK
ncbi:hypothetical protein AB6A40_007157 [Gnathostoma spinigerum]|uniref:BHLH domain-containing protein n=1 Tax=Gnathostoma spinigerum TaxID=75299 RepID=A0ABD6EKN9_9BILA